MTSQMPAAHGFPDDLFVYPPCADCANRSLKCSLCQLVAGLVSDHRRVANCLKRMTTIDPHDDPEYTEKLLMQIAVRSQAMSDDTFALWGGRPKRLPSCGRLWAGFVNWLCKPPGADS
jgi:hypothetical protein